jgi:hypothetical protein
MTDEKYKGRTQSEWRALRGGPSDYTHETATEIEAALLWFDKQDKKSRHDAEDRRFQIQLDEARRQGALTRRIALAAVVVAVISVLVGIWMHFHPIAPAPSATSTPSASSPSPLSPKP